jgi:hypothetical protein
MEGTVRPRHVLDGRITLRVTILLADGSGKSTMAGSNIIEYMTKNE